MFIETCGLELLKLRRSAMFVTFRSYGAKTGQLSQVSINISCLRHFGIESLNAILSPLVIKLRLCRLTVIRQSALRADGVRPLKDPVLPGSQTSEDFCV